MGSIEGVKKGDCGGGLENIFVYSQATGGVLADWRVVVPLFKRKVEII